MPRPVQNPEWVDDVVDSVLEDIGGIPPAWVPPRGQEGFEELGCGFYGCVLATRDPAVVLKVTTDDTEAEFARTLSSTLVAPVCVDYRATITTDVEHDGRPIHLLWRSAADRVGEIEDVVPGSVPIIDKLGKAGQQAFSAAKHWPQTLPHFASKWYQACIAVAEQQQIPELHSLGAGLAAVWTKQRIIFGDIHTGNLGIVGGRWVITDPGHIAVVADERLLVPRYRPSEVEDDVVLSARRYGRPSQRLFEVTRHGHPAEVMVREDAVRLLVKAMPQGFEPGLGVELHLDFSVVRGGTDHPQRNTVYIARPSEMVSMYWINATDTAERELDEVRRVWDAGGTIGAISMMLFPDGTAYMGGTPLTSQGSSLSATAAALLMVAAETDRRVAFVFRDFDPSFEVPEDAVDLTKILRRRFPDQWNLT